MKSTKAHVPRASVRRLSRQKVEPTAPPGPKASVNHLSTELPKNSRSQSLVAMMQVEGGASAAEMAEAIGWQVHSVRGFIAGTLKKRPGISVTTARANGVTRYTVNVTADAR